LDQWSAAALPFARYVGDSKITPSYERFSSESLSGVNSGDKEYGPNPFIFGLQPIEQNLDQSSAAAPSSARYVGDVKIVSSKLHFPTPII